MTDSPSNSPPPNGPLPDRGGPPETTRPLTPAQTVCADEDLSEAPTCTLESHLLKNTEEIAAELSAEGRAALEQAEREVPLEWHKGEVILGLYEVTDIFGEGATAMVYRVRHRTWNIDLAVKTPRAELLQAPRMKDNFEREAETWVNLGLHPNIACCYYVRRLGGVPRIFAEFVDGGDLSEWIRGGRLYAGGPQQALERILDVAIQSAWGLHYAHEQGLVHQDIKPANVMMTGEGTAKVTDFGLAKARAAAGELLQTGGKRDLSATCGGMTPAYCSPEQAEIVLQAQQGVPSNQRGKLNQLTDIWSWAVTVLEMFTGGVRWNSGREAPRALESCRQAGAQPGTPPPMPAEVGALLGRCFETAPKKRPRSMMDVAQALQEAYHLTARRDYARSVPRAADALADSMNNRGVSLLDLRRRQEAEQSWQRALEADPHHAESTYNRGIILWRSGRLNDVALLRQLEEVRKSHAGDWKSEYFLGLFLLERGDCEAALRILEGLSERGHPGQETAGPLAEARSRLPQTRKLLKTFEGHTGAVNAVCVFGDGLFALSGSGSQFVFAKEKDYTLRMWDLKTGGCLRVLQGHNGRVTSLSTNGDARMGASGSVDMTVRLWNLETGECRSVLEGHTSIVTSVCLSADGRRIVSGSRDMTLKLWDSETGRCIRTFRGHSGRIAAVALSPDADRVLSASDDTTVRLWESGTGQCIRTFAGHSAGVTSMSVSRDGQSLLTGGADAVLRLWRVNTGRCLRVFTGHSENISSVCLSPDGRYALSGGGDFMGREWVVKLWESGSGRCLYTFEGHAGNVNAVCFTPDGQLALSGSDDATVRLWRTAPDDRPYRAPLSLCRLRGSEEVASAQMRFEQAMTESRAAMERKDAGGALAHLKTARSLQGYSRNREALSAWFELYIRLPRRAFSGGWEESSFSGHGDAVCAVCVSRDGRVAFSGSEDAGIRMWRTDSGRCLRTLEGHTGSVLSVCVQDDSRHVLSGSGDATIKLWRADTGDCLKTLRGHRESVFSVCLSPDGRFALSGSRDCTIRLWDVENERCLRVLREHADGVTSVCLSHDSRMALSGSRDCTIRLWDVATGRCLRVFEERSFPVGTICFSRDSRRALSGGDERALRLWDVDTGRCLRVFEGHDDRITSVCLSHDSRFALSGSCDRTLRLWDTDTGGCLRVFQGHSYAVNAVCISRDAHAALSASEDKCVKLWLLDWELGAAAPADWSDGAASCLEAFLTVQTPYRATIPCGGTPCEEEIVQALTRSGKPAWTPEAFEDLLFNLGCAGYGWLTPAGVHKQLSEMAAGWLGPQSLPVPVPADEITLTSQGRHPGGQGKKQRSKLPLDLDE